MAWRLAATEYSNFLEYSYLWRGVMSREQVSELLETKPPNSIVLFDLPDICYPQLFHVARKTTSGRIDIQHVFAVNQYTFNIYLDTVISVNTMQSLFKKLFQRYIIIPNVRQHSYNGFYKQIQKHFYELHEYLHNGSLFWNYDYNGYALQAELDTTRNAAVVSISTVDYKRHQNRELVDIFQSNGPKSTLYWDRHKMFYIQNIHGDNLVSNVTSAVEAVNAFFNLTNLMLYDPFSLQRIAYRAMGGSGYRDYEKFPPHVLRKLNLQE